MLGHGDIDGEAEYDGEMQPPEDAVQGVGDARADARRRERLAQRTPDERVGVRALAARRHVKRLRQQREQHQRRDEQQDDRRFALLRQVELEAIGADSPPPDRRPHEYEEEGEREDVQIGREYPDPRRG